MCQMSTSSLSFLGRLPLPTSCRCRRASAFSQLNYPLVLPPGEALFGVPQHRAHGKPTSAVVAVPADTPIPPVCAQCLPLDSTVASIENKEGSRSALAARGAQQGEKKRKKMQRAARLDWCWHQPTEQREPRVAEAGRRQDCALIAAADTFLSIAMPHRRRPCKRH